MTDTEHPPARSPLVSFLLARIDEREKVAKAAAARVRRWPKATRPPWVQARAFAEEERHAALEAFEGRETPDEVLADCAALRAVLTLLRQYEAAIRQESAVAQPGDPLPETLYAARDALEEAVRLLAQPHSGHPAFDPSWAVDQS